MNFMRTNWKDKRPNIHSLLIVFFAVSFMSLVGFINQDPTKEQSSLSEKKIKGDDELQKQCGKQSKEYYESEYGNGEGIINGEDEMSNYTYHYNKKLNKCFILINSIEFIKNIEDKFENITMKTLFEFNENKEYGSLVLFRKNIKTESCFVLDKPCKSEQEWDLLVVPYMEE